MAHRTSQRRNPSDQARLRVAFNGVCNNRQGKLLGNFYHMLHLASALTELSDLDVVIIADEFTRDVYRRHIPRAKIEYVNCGRSNVLVRDIAIARAVNRIHPDVYHRATGQLPFIKLPCPAVMTVADLNWKTLKTSAAKAAYKNVSYWLSVNRAAWVTCISQATKKDLNFYYPSSCRKTSVVYHGSPKIERSPLGAGAGMSGSFLAFGHQEHKNVEVCMNAMCRVESASLKVIGDSRYIDRVLKPRCSELGLTARVGFLGRVSDSELARLYRTSAALLFMSRFEGFGLPVLEAMSAGCPVVSSNISSLPEVCGRAGIMLDPNDQRGLADVMQRLLSDGVLRTSLIAKGYRQAAFFSWSTAATKTAAIYRRVSQNQARIH